MPRPDPTLAGRHPAFPALDGVYGINHSLNMYRIIGADGREYGPISTDQLRQWIAENRANATTRILVEGTTEWKTLGSLPEFSTLFPAASKGAISPTPAPFPTRTTFGTTTNGFAVTGMVLGIFALTIGCCCCYGMPFNILGLIFSIIGLIQINANPERYTGRGIAITGIVLSILSFIISVVLLIIFGATSTWDQMRQHGYRL
jgi:hypothetical protein